MQYSEYLPAEPLRPYINSFWWLESGGEPEPLWDRTLPDGCLEMVLHLADPMLRRDLDARPERESRAILIGQTTRPYLFAATGNVRMLGVRFFPHTASLWLGAEIAQFNDQSVDLVSILPAAERPPIAAIENAGSPRNAVGLLEKHFLRQFGRAGPGRQEAYIRHACGAILRSGGAASISALSRDLGISNRYLERLFVRKVGVSPKFFARVIRFQRIFAALSGDVFPPLTELAQRAGYFDQSHFIRDFRALSGLTPGKFLRERHPMSGHFIEPGNRSYLYNFDLPAPG